MIPRRLAESKIKRFAWICNKGMYKLSAREKNVLTQVDPSFKLHICKVVLYRYSKIQSSLKSLFIIILPCTVDITYYFVNTIVNDWHYSEPNPLTHFTPLQSYAFLAAMPSNQGPRGAHLTLYQRIRSALVCISTTH